MRCRRHLAVLTAAIIGAGLTTVLSPSPASAGQHWGSCGSLRCMNGTTNNETKFTINLGLPGSPGGFTPTAPENAKYDPAPYIRAGGSDKWGSGTAAVWGLDVSISYHFTADGKTWVVGWKPSTAWPEAGGDRNACFLDEWKGLSEWRDQANDKNPDVQKNGDGTPFECEAPTPQGGFYSNVTLTLKAR